MTIQADCRFRLSSGSFSGTGVTIGGRQSRLSAPCRGTRVVSGSIRGRSQVFAKSPRPDGVESDSEAPNVTSTAESQERPLP